ncbi:ATP-dependent DNA helicase DinG [Rosenbergiella australiborealis]|uniref:ATP-dependent DNA helicase DinG n=1 Tax=Rosenbergiella australiborealis TaxID=1544696 RepID=A0ABS5T3S4_9GAMM|nr:ATP-dependent DNA helicase DinG [Rosenbergiella australiborealis]MBT0726999.1 ATP-dependent DNA helicase DinG [Rosenbergiella australiborealis]
MALTSAIKTQISDWYKKLQRSVDDFIPRLAQRQMMAEVAKTLAGDSGRHLAIEAPTGVGKTLSYLLPGIAVSREEKKTLVVSTANVALQDQIYRKDLPLLKSFIPDLTYTTAFGRRRYVCPRNLYFTGDNSQPDLLYLMGDDTLTRQAPGTLTPAEQRQCEQLQTALDKGSWDGVRDHYPENISDALWLRLSTDKTHCLAHHCQWYKDCPFFTARRDIDNVDVVITNHALVMAALESDSVLPPAKDILLIMDEGHHLPDVARDALETSAEITPAALALQLDLFAKAVEQISAQFTLKSPPALAKPERLVAHREMIDELLNAFAQSLYPLLHPIPEASHRFVMGELPEPLHAQCEQLYKLYDALRATCENLLNFLAEQTGKADMVRIHRGMLQLNRFFAHFEAQAKLWRLAALRQLSGAPVSKWATLEQGEEKPQLWFHCAGIRVSTQLENILWSKVPHTILTSATLRSLNTFNRFQELSGLNEKATDRFVCLDSPFNHAEQGKLVIPQMRYEPDFQHEAEHLKEMAGIFRQTLSTTPHLGVLVLFSSMRALQQFVMLLVDKRLSMLVQGDQPRTRLIELHRERVLAGQQSILVGLQSFAEGLDLKGDLLTAVHIHKIAFAPIDSPVIVTEGEWLKSKQRYPFESQSLPSASFTLIQQVGRLIRSHHCHGEIIIYDRRLITRRYGSRLLASLPVFPIEQPTFAESKASSRSSTVKKKATGRRVPRK